MPASSPICNPGRPDNPVGQCRYGVGQSGLIIMSISSTIGDILQGTTGALGPRMLQLGKDTAVNAVDFPLAQIIETLHGNFCALCAHVHGMILRKGTPEYSRWRLPSHINCRRIMVDIHRDEVGPDGRPTEPDFSEPSDELIRQHGHFVLRPKDYEALRLPSRPTGRDFIFSHGARGEAGTLVFAPALPDFALRETVSHLSTAAISLIGAIPDGQITPTLRQCAYQCARRRERFFDNLDRDFQRHGADWGGDLTPQGYAAIPERILSGEPWVATRPLYSHRLRKQMRCVVFYDEAEDASFFWDTATGNIIHPARTDMAKLWRVAAPNEEFMPLRGAWDL
jgi:hypothetical protein